MKTPISYHNDRTLPTLGDADRNFYQVPAGKAWEALKAGKTIELLGEFTETGWCLVFVVVDGKEYQLTKKKLRSSDLKYYFGRFNE